DQRGHMVLDRTGDEDDPLPQQPGIDVEAAFASVRLFDDDRDEAGNDVLMIHGNCGSLIAWRPTSGGSGKGSSLDNAAKGKGGRNRSNRLPPFGGSRRAALPPQLHFV